MLWVLGIKYPLYFLTFQPLKLRKESTILLLVTRWEYTIVNTCDIQWPERKIRPDARPTAIHRLDRPLSGLRPCQSLTASNTECFEEKTQPSVYICYDTIAKSCDLPAWPQWKMKTSGAACLTMSALRVVCTEVLIRKGMIIKLIWSAPPHSKLPLLLS